VCATEVFAEKQNLQKPFHTSSSGQDREDLPRNKDALIPGIHFGFPWKAVHHTNTYYMQIEYSFVRIRRVAQMNL